MTDVKTGLTPSRRRGGQPNSKAVNTYQIANGYGTALFAGDPVLVSAGFVQQAANTKKAAGVFLGCAYIDPATKQPVQSSYFPASTSSAGMLDGYSTPIALVVDDPDATFIMKANNTVSAGMVGSRFQVSIGTGSALTGRSAAVLDTALSVGTSAGHMVRVISAYNLLENNLGDDETVVEVEWSNFGIEGAQ